MDKPRVHAPFSVLTIIEEEPTQTVSNPVSVSALAIYHSMTERPLASGVWSRGKEIDAQLQERAELRRPTSGPV